MLSYRGINRDTHIIIDIRNDFIPEEDNKYFTLRIFPKSPSGRQGRFTCNEDNTEQPTTFVSIPYTSQMMMVSTTKSSSVIINS